MNDASPLGALGLDAVEEAAYRELVCRPGAGRDEIALAVSATPAELDRALAGLHGLGLAVRSAGRYFATPPAIALTPLVTARRDQLRLAELELAALAERYRVFATDRSAADLVEVITGVEVIGSRFQQLQAAATQEVQALVTARTLAVSRADNRAEDEGVRRGVRYRVVVEHAVLDEPGALDDLSSAMDSGEEIRVAERVPIKLVIADRAVAMLPMSASASAESPAEPAALIVHRSGLLDALQSLFDAMWSRAWPLRTSPAAPDLGPLDRQVLSLLLAGLTDRAISSHLGLSMRTVQRRVQRMMELAGVQTRVQLGWHAARAAWA